MARNKKPHVPKSRLSLLALEPRLVFDGAMAVDALSKLGAISGSDIVLRDPVPNEPVLLAPAKAQAQKAIAAWMGQAVDSF